MFIMKRIRRYEIGLNVDQNVIKAYKKMHAGYKVWVEWGTNELKRKWGQLMKMFNSTKAMCIMLFKVVVILINFLHKHQMDFTFQVVGEQLPNHVDQWDKDFYFYMSKICLTFALTSSSLLTFNFPTIFRLLILTLFILPK